MSQQDVHEIMCPYRDRELEQLKKQRPEMEKIILALRRKLIAGDPTLPNEYDGTSWMPLEGAYK